MTIKKNGDRPKVVMSFTLDYDVRADLIAYSENLRPTTTKAAIVSHALRVYFGEMKQRDPSLFRVKK